MIRFQAALIAGVAACFATTAGAQDLSIDITPAFEDLSDMLQGASLVYSLKADGTTNPQDYVAAARADYRRLLTGLYGEGYYGGTVSILIDGREASGIAPLEAPGAIGRIDFQIAPGPAFSFGRADITPLAPGTILPEEFAVGQPARAAVIRSAVGDSIDAWRDAGHAKAEPTGQQINANHPDSELNVAVQVDPGPRLTFGALTITGNENVRTDRIRDIAGLPVGQVFSPVEKDRALQRLRRTGAFQSVALIEGDNIAAGNVLPMSATIVEQTPRRIGFGAEISSTDGATLSGYWLHRNLLGGAERFRVEGEVSGLAGETGGTDYKLSFNFVRPATFNPQTDLYLKAGIERLDEPDYFLEQVTAEAGLIRRLGDYFIFEYGIGIRSGRQEDSLGARDFTLVTFPLDATLDRRDDQFDATSGYYLNVDLTPFAGFNDTDSGARLYADARYYRSFGANDRVTLAGRVQLGTLLAADARNVPSDLLFFSGGAGTVRGQSYQSLGVPVGGDQRGGSSFLGTQLEARVGITDNIGAVAFYDYGYIGADSAPLSDGDDHAGAGLGLRYDTGIGPIRLDVATPVGGDDSGSSVEIYIGIGQAF